MCRLGKCQKIAKTFMFKGLSSPHPPIVLGVCSKFGAILYPVNATHLNDYVATSSHYKTNYNISIDDISHKNHSFWSNRAKILEIFDIGHYTCNVL